MTPEYDKQGNIIRNKKGQPVADKLKTDEEDIPLNQDIDAFIERMVKPYNPDAWVDKKSMKTGYQIPFTKTFYRYQELEAADTIAERILMHEKSLEHSLSALFGKDE